MATIEGTSAFVSRLTKTRKLAGFASSPFGFGCYRVGSPESIQALQSAVLRGCNVLDTSSNYQEVAVGQALHELLEKGQVAREELLVVSKCGSIQGEGMEIARQLEAQGKLFEGVVKVHPSFWHCMSPDFVKGQLEASRSKLGTSVDGYLLHNPEFFFSPFRQQDERPEDEFYHRLRRAFVALEEEVRDGGLQFYGISTNVEECQHSVSGGDNDKESTSLSRILQEAKAAAKEVGASSHNMRVLQVPANILEPSVIMNGPNLGMSDTLKLAANENVSVVVNRPLNSIPAAGFGAGDWGREAEHLKLANTIPMRPSLALIRNLLHDTLTGIEGHSRMMSLQQLALWVAISNPGVDCVLNGARIEPYVDDMIAVSSLPLIPEEKVRECYRIVDMAVKEAARESSRMW